MTLPKRTLLEADPNAPRAPTNAKHLKKTNDGKENEEITEWYATLQTEELRELCKVRGKHVAGNRVQLIEYLQGGDKEGNPSEEERKHQLSEKYRAWKDNLDYERSKTIAKLVVEGASGDLAKQSLDRMAAEGHVERVKKDTYNRNYNDSKVVELVALCNILGLPNNGTKDELVERLYEYDDSIRKDSIEYKEAQKTHAVEQSPAGKRAIEIEAASLAERMCIERGVSDDIQARTLVQLEAKELAVQRARVQLDFIADYVEYTQPKGTLPNGDSYGAFLLASKISDHGTSATHATTLHIIELKQLLALKNCSTDGTKAELIERLHALDYVDGSPLQPRLEMA